MVKGVWLHEGSKYAFFLSSAQLRIYQVRATAVRVMNARAGDGNKANYELLC